METTTIETIVTLGTTSISTHPGAPTEVEVRIKNLSTRVHRYQLTVIGPVAGWVTIAEPLLTATDRGGEAATSIYFSAPGDDSAPAGQIPFGIVATSDVDGHSVCEEGQVEVAAAPGVAIVPLRIKAKGRWKATIPYEIVNTGNDEARLALVGHSPTGEVDCEFDPDIVSIPAGEAQITHLRAKVRRPKVRGAAEVHQIEAACHGHEWGAAKPEPGSTPSANDQHHRPAAPVALNQIPIISGLVIAIAVLIVALIALYLFWPRERGTPEVAGPATPAAPVVLSEEHDTITISWEQSSGALSYEIGVGADRQTIDATLGTFTHPIEGLEPEQEYTIRLTALGVDGAASPPVTAVGSTTVVPTLSPLSLPRVAPTQGFAGTPFEVSWDLPEGEQIESGDTFTVLLDGEPQPSVIENLSYRFEPPAGTERTYRVQVRWQRGEDVSGLSEPATLTVTGDPPPDPDDEDAGGGGGGETVDGTLIAALMRIHLAPATNANPAAAFNEASNTATDLEQLLEQNMIVRTTDQYLFQDTTQPGPVASSAPGAAVFAGPFEDIAAAQAFCDRVLPTLQVEERCVPGTLTSP